MPIVTGDVVALQGKVIVDSLGRSLEATSVAVTDSKIPEYMDGAGNIRPSNPSSFLPTRVTITGYISNRKNGSFVLTDEVGTVFQVLTEGRKGIGVESPIEDWRAPDGLKIQVFGYVGDTAHPGQFDYSLYPVDKGSMRTVELTALEKLKRAAGWSACIFRATRSNHLALSTKTMN